MKKAPRRGPPRSLGVTTAAAAVTSVLTLRGIADAVRGERVISEWTDLVGAKIAQRTRPDGISDRVLWVEVSSSAWMHELNLLRPQLVRGLLERLGEPRLFDEVRFRLAGRHRRGPTVPPLPRPAPGPGRQLSGIPASGAAREAIERETSIVDDDDLRALIARVRIAHDR